jgi:aryl-alcohol dehydrogenase-like predicted oxidoreductase
VLETVRDLGIGFVSYSPLGRGMLTGRFASPDDIEENDFRKRHPRFSGDNFQQNLDLVAVVDSVAKEKGCTPGQVALAWVLSRGEDVVPIPGTKRRSYLEENAAAVEIELANDELARLEEAFPHGVAQGERYADMSAIDR